MQAAQRRTRSRGFSLLEVLITIAIIALISGAVALGLFKYFGDAQVKATRENGRSVRRVVIASRLDQGNAVCPTVAQLIESGDLDEDSPRQDPWGGPYKVVCTEGRVMVSSNGPDRQPGTSDDIVVPEGAQPAAAP